MLTTAQRKKHLDWLLALTSIPTAAGREHRVIAWIDEWLKRRRNLKCRRDRFGNMMIEIKDRRGGRPLLLTAHLDHPAFVVCEVKDDSTLRLEFRGGIRSDYYENGRIVVHDSMGNRHRARILDHRTGDRFDEVTARLLRPAGSVQVDDIATWDLRQATVRKDRVHAPACDDLAAAAAALSALDVLRRKRTVGDVRVLLTRAEEVGFLGAILASEHGFIAKRSRIIALENSRSFPESPIGAGPIIRVGDRISVFHHGLTFAVTQVGEHLRNQDDGFRYQRKLMPGGACEATAFQAYGYDATCVCLPLGNYHNMGDIDAVYAGTNKRSPKADSEIIGLEDYHQLVELLIGCGEAFTASGKRRSRTALPDPDGARAILERMRGIRDRQHFVLTEKASEL